MTKVVGIKFKNGGQLYYFCADPGAEKECALMKTDDSGALHVWTGVDEKKTN